MASTPAAAVSTRLAYYAPGNSKPGSSCLHHNCTLLQLPCSPWLTTWGWTANISTTHTGWTVLPKRCKYIFWVVVKIPSDTPTGTGTHISPLLLIFTCNLFSWPPPNRFQSFTYRTGFKETFHYLMRADVLTHVAIHLTDGAYQHPGPSPLLCNLAADYQASKTCP